MTNFIPHTSEERKQMLQTIGVASVEALFDVLPASLKKGFPVKTLPEHGANELDLQKHLTQTAGQNAGAFMESFLGGGAYHRFIPPAVNAIASRSEFYTAYTPYQPEVSQGTLQVIYEFQTMMSELTGMDITNASVYDGAVALTESALMALRATKRKQIVCSKTVNPQYQQVLQTYVDALPGITLSFFDPDKSLESQIPDPKHVATVLIQQPDYYGAVSDWQNLKAFCEKSAILIVASVDPTSLGVLETPLSYGAQIVCGDIQPFGNGVNYGGPYGGFVSTTEKLIRQLPGRLVGRTLDKEGKTAYTLTLQTREQHIRREKATSNICTNQSLNVLKAATYLSLVGPQGLKQISEVSAQRAHQLAHSLCEMPGVSLRFPDKPFLFEFALKLSVPASFVVSEMAERFHILAGVDVGKYIPEEETTLLVAVTEMNSIESLGRYTDAFRAVLGQGQVAAFRSGKQSPGLATGTYGQSEATLNAV